MSKRTVKYNLGYFEQGDLTSPVIEMQRWETLDAQLSSLYSVIGNGVLEGWKLLPSSALSIVVTPGKGNVAFVAVETNNSVSINDIIPNTRNYIYASLTNSSYWDQSVDFIVLSTQDDVSTDIVYLGYVDTNGDSVIETNIDGRKNLGFVALIKEFIADHHHIGGTDNPPPIDLGSEVQGIINQRNLPELDASIIKAGTINENRLPNIDHITKLINQGTLTHAQLDSFAEALSIKDNTLMGETSTINLLQLVLALKHVYPDIDEFLVNEIAYIPGISPDSYVDWDNTTAEVDTKTWDEGGQHTITGESAPAREAYVKTWNSEEEFQNASKRNVIVNGDFISLDVFENTIQFDDFSDVSKWVVETIDLSSDSTKLTSDSAKFVVTPTSGKLLIGNQEIEMSLLLKRAFDAIDWSDYDFITFYFYTESVQHGDVFFFINDAFDGIQNSYTKILDRNTATMDIDTLENGWQEMTIDIRAFSRENINTIGLYISTQQGWDTSKGFDFNIDDINLTQGNKFRDDGHARFVFGNNNFPYEFWRIRWDAIIPTDVNSDGVDFKVRSRVGNNLLDLNQAIWSSYTSVSGSEISLPSNALYKFIEIEVYFGASNDNSRSAYLKKLYLDFYASDIDSSFTFETQDDWESGDTFNINLSSLPDSMVIAKTEEVNDIFYGSQGNSSQLDDDLAELYKITGSMLPRSTYQVLNGLEPGLGLITGVARGNGGTIWSADIDNDRIVEIDKAGSLIKGFYGSFIKTPQDNYGLEEYGPGSNVSSEFETTTTTTTLKLGSTLEVLQAIYNSSSGILYIVFNDDLENIYANDSKLNLTNIYIKIGTQRFYLNDSNVELLGLPMDKYNNWEALSENTSEYAEFIDQFSFDSHVLKITLQGADKVLLNHMVDDVAPSIVISSPQQNEVSKSNMTVSFLVNNFEIGSAPGENGIRVTLDESSVQDVYDDKITFQGLSNGIHSIKAQLLNADGSLNTNIEAIAEGQFIVSLHDLSVPHIYFTSPRINQIYSSSPVVVEFEVNNFPVLPTGQHLRYIVDSDAPIDYYSTHAITIEDLEAGSHSIKIYMVDDRGNDLDFEHGSITVNFIVGLNSKAITKLYIDPKAIYNSDMSLTTSYIRKNIDVSDIYFANVYSPIDIQILPADTSSVNLDGLPTMVVSKLRSRSWLGGLGGEDKVNKFISAIQNQAEENPEQVTNVPSDVKTLIFGTKYLDGHSVVQLNMQGEIIFSNNAAIFAKSKTEAKTLLGSGYKLGDNELLIADSYRKRAIITYTDLDTEIPYIEWEYSSDRYISDFHIESIEDLTISIKDDSVSNSDVFIRQGFNVIWQNDSSSPISIYSGKTTLSAFEADPDLNLYGDVFKSEVLRPGERFVYKFTSVGEMYYFIYPGILVGKITVTRNRISDLDRFLILENDGLESPFSSRAIKVDAYGNVLWSFGEGYLVNPRDVRPLLNNGILIST